ncbi:hypothetical protein ACHQM5_000684 [Ranunculus cassubicifolius]
MKSFKISGEIKCEASSEVIKDDAFYIRRCVEIAKKAIGCTSPNPMVGCVIVKDGVIVGEGFHPKAGQPHAEVFALREAGDLAENATAYVSLEPCNHFGRTPPCSEALICAKVKRVVVGTVDPNPIVASRGVAKLRDAGIEVKTGVEEEMCMKLIEAFSHRMLVGKPFLTLRYSLSVNGRLSDGLNEEAKKPGGYYSQLLQEYDGIIYTSKSISGESFPTSQEPGAKQPLQIIISSPSNPVLQLPNLTPETASQVVIFTEKNTEINSKLGVETVVLEKLDLSAILDYCMEKGLCSVLLDLRGSCRELDQLVEEGVESGLLMKVVMELLPVWDGSEESLVAGNLGKSLGRLEKLESNVCGGSVVVSGYF